MINLLRRLVKAIVQRELYSTWYAACMVTALLVGGLMTAPIALDVARTAISVADGIVVALIVWPRKNDLRQMGDKFYFQEFSQMSVRVRGVRLLAMLLLLGTLFFGYHYLYLAGSCFFVLNALALWQFEKRNNCAVWRGSFLRKEFKQQTPLEQSISR